MRKKTIIIALFIFYYSGNIVAQDKFIDSLVDWINKNPKIDSQYIQTLHRISYRLNEKDVEKSYAYYEKVFVLKRQPEFHFWQITGPDKSWIFIMQFCKF